MGGKFWSFQTYVVTTDSVTTIFEYLLFTVFEFSELLHIKFLTYNKTDNKIAVSYIYLMWRVSI